MVVMSGVLEGGTRPNPSEGDGPRLLQLRSMERKDKVALCQEGLEENI